MSDELEVLNADEKFSDFADGVNPKTTDTLVGLRGGVNYKFTDLSVMKDSNNLNSVNYQTRRLFDTAGNLSVNFSARIAYGNNGNSAIDWNAKTLSDLSGILSQSWQVRAFYDPAGITALNYSARSVYSSNGSISINWQNRTMFDSTPSISADYNQRVLIDQNDVGSVYWGNDADGRKLVDASNQIVVNWQAKTLNDSSAIKSTDWTQRQLIANDGATVVLDWSNPSGIVMPNSTPQRVYYSISGSAGGNGSYASPFALRSQAAAYVLANFTPSQSEIFDLVAIESGFYSEPGDWIIYPWINDSGLSGDAFIVLSSGTMVLDASFDGSGGSQNLFTNLTLACSGTPTLDFTVFMTPPSVTFIFNNFTVINFVTVTGTGDQALKLTNRSVFNNLTTDNVNTLLDDCPIQNITLNNNSNLTALNAGIELSTLHLNTGSSADFGGYCPFATVTGDGTGSVVANIFSGTVNNVTTSVPYLNNGEMFDTTNNLSAAFGSRNLVANDGATVSVDYSDPSTTNFNTVQGLEFQVAAGAAPVVNYISVNGAPTDNEPIINFTGDDTDVGGTFQTKGAGGYDFTSTIGTIFMAENVGAGAVNYFILSNSTTGVAPSITAFGTDTDVDFDIITQAAGLFSVNGSRYKINTSRALSAVNYRTITPGTFYQASPTNDTTVSLTVAMTNVAAVASSVAFQLSTDGITASDTWATIQTEVAIINNRGEQLTGYVPAGYYYTVATSPGAGSTVVLSDAREISM